RARLTSRSAVAGCSNKSSEAPSCASARPARSHGAHRSELPTRGRPGADEHRLCTRLPESLQKVPADPAPLVSWQHVGVTNEIDVAQRLQAHDPLQRSVLAITPECHATCNLPVQFID